MSKYGANGADDALGICLYGLIVSAAVRGYHKHRHRYRHRSGDGVDKRSERQDNNNNNNEEEERVSSLGSICIVLDHLETFVPSSIMGK